MKKENVLIMGCSSAPGTGGGISSYSTTLAQGFKKIGWDVYYVCPIAESEEWLLDCTDGYHLIDLTKDAVFEVFRLSDFIDAMHVTAIINNDNPYLQSLAPLSRCPFISIGHSEKNSIQAMACFQYEYLDYIVAISNDMRDYFVNRYNVPTTKVVQLSNGLDLSLIHI